MTGSEPRQESAFVEWLTALPSTSTCQSLGIGDDMAVIETRGTTVLLSSDMLLDGVHFESAKHSGASIGRKAIACSLSDCAAMAAIPRAVTVSIAYQHGTDLEFLKQIMLGASAMASAYDCALSGGDTTSWDQRLAIDVTIMAEPVDPSLIVKRSNAQEGDAIFVTGKLGGSLMGRHMSFEPRVQEGQSLARHLQRNLHAMMDITDGLSLDLHRMCRASSVGAVLFESGVDAVISDAAREMSLADGRSPLSHALSDGEDFELLFTVPQDCSLPEQIDALKVGEIIESGFFLQR
ncbi:MAG: thiamine-phosphate kinase, partial [Phycisphaerae bacterium]